MAVPATSKRSFLQDLIAVAASFGIASTARAALPGDPTFQPTRRPGMEGKRFGMLVDMRKCIGCQACTVSCIQENAVPEGSFRTVVSTYSVKLTDSAQPAGTYVLPRLCNHCDNPPCIPVCPVSATYKREDGIVVVDGDRCVGCAYCVQACPYDARFINHETNKADKCTFCAHRVDVGLLPACVETCVGGARIFGDVNDPQSYISKRLKAAAGKTRVLKPEAGTNPHVFYIGLDDQLSGRVDGVSAADMMWRPGHQGG